jgi:ABC-2 type transport system permease protein
MIRIGWAFLQRDLRINASYPAGFAFQFVTVVFTVALLFYIGTALGRASGLVPGSNVEYFPFLLVGIAFVDYLSSSVLVFAGSVREGQMVGTLEMVLAAPVRLPVIVVASALWSYLFSAVRFLLMMLVAVVFFGFPLAHANLVGAAAVFLISVGYLMGLGIVVAALILLFKQAQAVTPLVMAFAILLGGVAYPLDVLPGWLRVLAAWAPFSHSVTALRDTLLLGRGGTPLLAELGFLAAWAVALVVVGLMVFVWSVDRVKRTGTLAHY